jgi:HD superfamily phosphodiesterase
MTTTDTLTAELAHHPLVVRAGELARHLLATQDQRLRHVAGAARAAIHVASRMAALPSPQIVAAAWLHDIGYSEQVRASGFHPLDGADYLEGHGWDALVVRLVAHHSHALVVAPYYGVEQDLLRFSPIHGLTADVLAYADLVSGLDGTGVTVASRIAELRSRTRTSALVPDDAREERYRRLRESAASVRRALRPLVRTGD